MEQKQPVIIILKDSIVEMETTINEYIKEGYTSIVTFNHYDKESASAMRINKPMFYCVLVLDTVTQAVTDVRRYRVTYE